MHALPVDGDVVRRRAGRQLRRDPLGKRFHAPKLPAVAAVVLIAPLPATPAAIILAAGAILVLIALATPTTAVARRSRAEASAAAGTGAGAPAAEPATAAGIPTTATGAGAATRVPAAAGATAGVTTATTTGARARSVSATTCWRRSSRAWPAERSRPSRLAFARLVDPEHAAVELVTVELLHRLLRELRRRHLDEREAARTTGLTIHDDGYAGDLPAVCCECCSE
jgi:hypothetical protein